MATPDDVERRFSQGRASVDRAEGRRIKGNAIVFNSVSHVLHDRYIGRFREIVVPEAVDRTMRSGAAVKALWNHNTDLVLGNTKSGTLQLRKTTSALAIEVDPPLWADPQLETIQRGDVDGMSFAFGVTEDGDWWDFKTEDGIPLRTVTDMTFSEVSFVAFPAYGATEVSVSKRSLEAFTDVRAKQMGKSLDWWRKWHRTALAK